MKNKPNTSQFNLKKDPKNFLESGSADMADRSDTLDICERKFTEEDAVIEKIYREQKIFRLPLELIKALKTEAYKKTLERGVRVTETEIVEKAIKVFLDI